MPETWPEWPLDYFRQHPAYAPLLPLLEQFPHFPALDDLARLPAPRNTAGLPIRFVDPDSLTHYYETEIAELGRVATRANWHDLFNALVWLTFPRSKSALNSLHRRVMATATDNARGPVRDAATLFDECGLIVASSEPALFTRQRDHAWDELFIQHRQDWGTRIEAVSFGHANYEALLDPFAGLTGKSWQIPVSPDYFDLPQAERIAHLDARIATLIDGGELTTPRQLPPLPYLGIPGWWPQQDAAFYANTRYFRPQRKPA
ncbi:DUF3025 domain-containing protein [Andreprevotia chitinilytica]|uniref:DUF3025 domain-containing protein n=1 Tax=Andreprevotia chitinilytica TaxID=396808 RepID=UPI00068FEC52|nr:DUF3025 domain-containing protein [Andreprevotia chitinilytica]